MRRLLMVVLLSCSFTAAAQTDERRIRTVEIDTAAHRAGLSDESHDGAEHPDEHMVLARQLVNLGPESEAPSGAGSPCVPAPDALRKQMTASYRASPADFHGISPQSAYWPEVEKAWRDYYLLRCGAQGDESPAEAMARSYAANLSTAQLREVVAFQDSPSGRAFIAATQRAREELEGAVEPRPKRDPAEASATFLQAMLQLKAKYESAPK